MSGKAKHSSFKAARPLKTTAPQGPTIMEKLSDTKRIINLPWTSQTPFPSDASRRKKRTMLPTVNIPAKTIPITYNRDRPR